MKRYQALVAVFLFIIFTAVGAQTIVLNGENDSFYATTITSSETELVLNISSIKMNSGDDGLSPELPEHFKASGWISGPAQTILPTYSAMLVIPGDAVLSVSVEVDEFTEIRDFQLASASEEDRRWLSQVSTDDEFYPGELVDFEYAGKMRDLHLARLTVYPVQYDYSKNVLRIHHQVTIKASHAGGDILPSDRIISEAFYPIYNAILSNGSLIDDVQLRRGGYWFIVHDYVIDDVTPLTEWKKAKGFDVRVYPLSEIGSNPSHSTIRNFILNEYNDAELKPDYICLVGDASGPTRINTYTYNDPHGPGSIDSDNYYTFLEGNDYFPELFIGRIAVDYTSELNNYIDKHFGYERTPYMDETDWYHYATMVAGSDYQSPRLTKLWCREMLMNHGYTDVDTFLSGGDSPSAINASINDGVTFVNYRGYGSSDGWAYPWYRTYHISQLTNGPKYGVMTSIVCATGDYNDYLDVCFGEGWIRYANKGGPGFIGPTNLYTHTKWNNVIDSGIYWGLFEEGTYALAQALLMGKMTMYNAFPGDTYPNGRVQQYFHTYNNLGDPELNCWIDIPKAMQAAHAESINTGECGLDVVVTHGIGFPMENAYVCLWKGDEVFQGSFTDINGHACFQVNPTTSGVMALTVTKPNYIPYEYEINVQDAEVSVGLCSFSVDDDDQGNSSGDGDMIANPTEVIELSTILKNFGFSQAAVGVSAELLSDDPAVEIISSTSTYGDISPGDSTEAVAPFVVSIASQVPDGYSAELALEITDDNDNSWQSFVFLPISSADLNVNSVSIQADNNGNDILDRGESAEMVLELLNSGSKGIYSTVAILRTSDPLVQITDSIGHFGDLEIEGSGSNSIDPFALTVLSNIYNGHMISFILEATGESGQVQLFEFEHMVGEVSDSDPFGPDEYGYYCFDNTDTSYLYHPEYDWINIETSWDYVSLYDDRITTRNLPFGVTYYGETYDEFSISDNGYITLGHSWWSNFLNSNIPSPQSAPAMVAALWDDLSNNYSPLVIRYHHDEDNNRFIIGWNNARSNDNLRYYTFEIIILDTEHWPTATGDNEIIFQYYSCPYPNSNSTGICNRVRDIGLQYMFNGDYTDGAANLVSGRAIKFTTGSDYLVEADDRSDNLPGEFRLSQNYPNPFNATTRISYDLPVDCNVKLEIFDLLGRKVNTLVDKYQAAGYWSMTWDGKDHDNQTAAAGMYFYRLQAGYNQDFKKMILLK